MSINLNYVALENSLISQPEVKKNRLCMKLYFTEIVKIYLS